MLVLYLMLFILTIFTGIQWMQQRSIKRWKKDLNLEQHFAIYRSLYADVDGFTLSRAARMNHDSMEYVYGEIEFESFIALLALCHPNPSTIFYDLGSGVGKAVIACALVFDVKKSCGIEILPALHECALMQQQRLGKLPAYEEKASHIEFKLGDLLKAQFRDASLIFINATAFFGESWLSISQHMEQINPGALVISTSKALRSNLFKISKVTEVAMSWGIVRAFIQERQSPSKNQEDIYTQ
ncbi:putative methyltransferases [Legionella lansingensis]|uniref:Histone-lysine N-methyltransferase, H3 lysine-79 specific n=1 Tax=Legionella lansingensis TaxID=45067 RepID=A0A0W0VRJ2_9GAMM|nr:hypothetical protein [Legionella lansingensis]KTD22750.1 putative methyltransferase [Legionella lansingensis]SNV56853.1 putative methyltransferases [Legionella lansingensis]